MINGENFFDQRINNNKITYENIRKIATGQEDDYTTGCLLDFPYFKFSRFKFGFSSFKKNCVICFIERPLKMMKNAFYFILKAFFVLKIFKFLS